MKKKKYRYLAKAKFNEKTGTSYVILNTELGQFRGDACCSPEDFDYCSKFFGCGLAELRASMKYWQLRRIHAKAGLAAIKEVVMATMPHTTNAIYNIKDKYEKEVHQCNEALEVLRCELHDSIAEREKAVNLARKKKSASTKNENK